MDQETARARAEQKLSEIEGEFPLRLTGNVEEREAVWAFGFNSIRYLDEDDFLGSVPSGPIIVPKDGAPPWVGPSAFDLDRALERMGPHGDQWTDQ